MFLFSKKCSANLDIYKHTDNSTHTYAHAPCTDHTPSLNIISRVQYTSNNSQSLHKVYKIQTGDEKLAFSILKLKRHDQTLLCPSFPALSTENLPLAHRLEAGSLSQACTESSPGRNHPWHSGVSPAHRLPISQNASLSKWARCSPGVIPRSHVYLKTCSFLTW